MSLKKFSFNVINNDGFARRGVIQTHRGNIDTPVFMPVGTQATIKGAFINDVVNTGAQIILSSMHQVSSILLVSSSIYFLYLNNKSS